MLCYRNGNEDSSTSCCEHPNTTQECSCKSKNAQRHPISPDTSSQLRKGITGELKSKINLNLNTKIISKQVNSNHLKILINKSKNSTLDNRINSDTLHQQDQKTLVAKNAKNTE